MNEPTVIIIVGPTAVGKTAAAVHLAQQLSTKIISADSRQCFKELNIGVAKPSPEELQAVHHYFISSHSIHEEVTAALFEALALQWTDDIFKEQKKAGRPPVAIMVGGTGLYIKAFTEGLDTIPSIDPLLRQEIQQQYATAGMDWLQQQVKDADPAFFQSGEIHNPQRLMRALEVKRSTGRSILDFRTQDRKPRPFNIKTLGLDLPRPTLIERIDQRVNKMMDQGLLDEVKALHPQKHLNALQTVGYTELFDHLEGRITLDEAIEHIKVNTRRYAKRQMTWFRKDPSVRWIDAGEGLSKDNLTLILS